MASTAKQPASDLCAVVTGANKGIGLATVRLLALRGVTVVLTGRNEKLGLDAVESLRHEFGLSNVIFHQLDVRDSVSVANLAQFIAARFGRLDILVNNAGSSGLYVEERELKALNIDTESWLSGKAVDLIQEVVRQTYDGAVECVDTNYYGCKRVIEALLPSLQISSSGARIVNVSSLRSQLKGEFNGKAVLLAGQHRRRSWQRSASTKMSGRVGAASNDIVFGGESEWMNVPGDKSD